MSTTCASMSNSDHQGDVTAGRLPTSRVASTTVIRNRIVVSALALLLPVIPGTGTPQAQALEPLGQAELRIIERSLGRPSFEVRLAGGVLRRFYVDAFNPVRTWRGDVDANGHLTRYEPALTSFEYAQAQPGQWRIADLQEHFGLPDELKSDTQTHLVTLSYDFRENSVLPAVMVFVCDSNGVLQRKEVRQIVQEHAGRFTPRITRKLY